MVQNSSVSWLSISLESAFGSKTNVFYVHKTTPSQTSNWKKTNFSIFIHPQAASFVCRNVLDILIFLAKTFPEQFLSYSSQNSISKNLSSSSLNSSVIKSESQDIIKNIPSFFDVLMRHDSIHSNNKKAKSKYGNFFLLIFIFNIVKFIIFFHVIFSVLF